MNERGCRLNRDHSGPDSVFLPDPGGRTHRLGAAESFSIACQRSSCWRWPGINANEKPIGIVALLDIPDADVILLLTPLTQSHCNVLACRDHFTSGCNAMLAWPGAREENHGR